MIQYALSFLGTPYKWGGSNPISGIDCSGFVQECLMAVGEDLPNDNNAQSFYDHFLLNGTVGKYGMGALAFYGKSPKEITHIVLLLNSNLAIGANGGSSKVLMPGDADKFNAFVKIRPVDYRPDLIGVIMPKYKQRTLGV